MDQNSQFDYELKRKRELARGYVKKYREKKRQEAQQRKLPLQKEQIPQHKLERQRELSRERSRRYRDKKRLCTMKTFKNSIHDSRIPGPSRFKRPLAAENQRTTIQNSWSPATSTNMNIPLVVNDYSGNVNDDDLFQTRPNNLILIKEEPNIDERFITEDEDESAINIEIKKEIDSENDEVGDIEMKQGTNAGFSSVITNEEDIANTRIKKEVDSDGSTEMELYDESNQIEIKEEVDLGITTGDGDKDGEGGVLQQYSTSHEGDAVSSSYRRGELISQDKSAEKRYKCGVPKKNSQLSEGVIHTAAPINDKYRFLSNMEKKEDLSDSQEKNPRKRKIDDTCDDEKKKEEILQKNREKYKRYREKKKKDKTAALSISTSIDEEKHEERLQKNREKYKRYRENRKKKIAALLWMLHAHSSQNNSNSEMNYAGEKDLQIQNNIEKCKRYRDKIRTSHLLTPTIPNRKNVSQTIHSSQSAGPPTQDVPYVPPVIHTSQIAGPSTRDVPYVLSESTN